MALRESLDRRWRRVEEAKATGRSDAMLAASEAIIVPRPGQIVTYPSAERWRQITEARKRSRQRKQKPPEPWEEEIHQSLRKPISFEFSNTPLEDVLGFMHSTTNVNIILDRGEIPDPEQPVTLTVNKMTAKTALKWVLTMVDLDYSLMNEALFVSTRKRLGQFKPEEMRIYDFDDLLRTRPSFGGAQAGMAGEAGGLLNRREAADDWVEFLKRVLSSRARLPKEGAEEGME